MLDFVFGSFVYHFKPSQFGYQAYAGRFDTNGNAVWFFPLETYYAIGGIAGALAHRADELYATLSPPEQQAARQILMRLVTLGEGTEDTRRSFIQYIGNHRGSQFRLHFQTNEFLRIDDNIIQLH